MPELGCEYLLAKSSSRTSQEVRVFSVTEPETSTGTITTATLVAYFWGSTDASARHNRFDGNLPDSVRWLSGGVMLDPEEREGLEVIHEPVSAQRVCQAAVKLGRENGNLGACFYEGTPKEIIDAINRANDILSSGDISGDDKPEPPTLEDRAANSSSLRTGLYL